MPLGVSDAHCVSDGTGGTGLVLLLLVRATGTRVDNTDRAAPAVIVRRSIGS